MDLAPFRARRILFSWTAYLAGFGRPAWILEAYALQNVVSWIVLAVLLAWWMPPTTPRGLAAWTACLFSHGVLWSARFALLDGPSLALTAYAVRLVEQGHDVASALVAGVNGLGRETNVLGALAQPLPRSWRGWLRLAGLAALVVLPLLVWEDYLRSIYRSNIFAGVDAQTSLPGVEFTRALIDTVAQTRIDGLLTGSATNLCILGPLMVQAVFLLVSVTALGTSRGGVSAWAMCSCCSCSTASWSRRPPAPSLA